MTLSCFTGQVVRCPAVSRRIPGDPSASKPPARLRPRSARGFLAWSGTAAALLAILLASGTHWVALQAFAFGSMIVRYAQSAPLSEAIANTFDGEHPCPLCHAVQTGRQQEERKRPVLNLQTRIDLAQLPQATEAHPPLVEPTALPALRLASWHSRTSPPPKPPPRSSRA